VRNSVAKHDFTQRTPHLSCFLYKKRLLTTLQNAIDHTTLSLIVNPTSDVIHGLLQTRFFGHLGTSLNSIKLLTSHFHGRQRAYSESLRTFVVHIYMLSPDFLFVSISPNFTLLCVPLKVSHTHTQSHIFTIPTLVSKSLALNIIQNYFYRLFHKAVYWDRGLSGSKEV